MYPITSITPDQVYYQVCFYFRTKPLNQAAFPGQNGHHRDAAPTICMQVH